MANTRAVLPSGREVGLDAFGDPVADRIVIVCHPTPGSGLFDPDPLVTNRWGVHVVALDRPGYGGSAALLPDQHHSLRERAQDVNDLLAADERVADAITAADIHRFGVVGWGTGAIVAAAIAVQRPDMVDAIALVSPPAPKKAAKLARRTLALPHSREALHIADDDPAFDRHLGLRGRLDRMLDEAYRQGNAGIDGDRELMANTPWIDELHRVDAPVLLVRGADDGIADDDDLRWWSRHLRHTESSTIPGSASLAIADGWGRVLGHVAPNHGDIQERLRDHGQPALPDVPPAQR